MVMVMAVFAWVGRVRRFRAMVERSPSRVGKLCTGKPSGVVLVSALSLARSETSAGSTGVSRRARSAVAIPPQDALGGLQPVEHGKHLVARDGSQAQQGAEAGVGGFR